MLQKIPLQNILFLDIETVPESETFEALSPVEKQLWEKKTAYQRKDEHTPEAFYERAGIWAEFGKIICISVGFFVIKNDSRSFRVSSFSGDEISILQDFGALLNDYFNGPQHLLCGHNGKEFDFPYIARRMLIHNIKLPGKLNLFGKKPWEIPHLDTMELWRFGDYKHFTSLALLTHVLQIPTPKDDIDGSQVAEIYYKEKNLERIVKYCEKDTIAVAQVFLRLRGEPILAADEIVSV
jgi:predicted PolB exonuclease-like 3'-5' exonuclease